jgi:hypothetical protein
LAEFRAIRLPTFTWAKNWPFFYVDLRVSQIFVMWA